MFANGTKLARLTIAFAMLCASVLAMPCIVGCAPLRVPAFDPTGERIFSGQCTEVSLPKPGDCVPKPAFPNVGKPPPCLPHNAAAAPCGGKHGSICPAAQLRDSSYVVMMPGRVVAPVGSEVIVVSGICGETGNYVTRQPLEWMLAPDSVGHIMQVSNDKWSFVTDLFSSTSAKKLDLDWARTKSHTHRQTVTRGTKNLADDVVLGKGQSWVSVYSPTEGATHVTALANKEENWDRRRQTATIYWVDAQWVLPTPQIVRVDRREPAILTTTLARSQNLGAIEGWLVRYEAIDGPAATFENGLTSIEVPSDINGNASARLTPQSGSAGITQVAVQIVRPGSRNGEIPRMVVGQGGTSVTWSAPGLAVRATGPATADADAPITYRVEVANTGDISAPDVVLSYSIPQGTRIVSTNPPAQPFGDRLEWRLGEMPARAGGKVVEVTVAMQLHASYQHCFRAVSMQGGQPVAELQAQGCATTIVNRSALAVRTSGSQSAPVGSQVKFLVEIENTSSLPVTNIVLTDTFDAGLQHVTGQTSPMRIPIPEPLQPGQKRGVMLTFNVVAAGRHCHRMDVTADGGVKAVAEGCVTATSEIPVPRLAVRMTGPERLNVGDSGLYSIEIRNTGTLPLTNLRIGNRYSSSLLPTRATENKQLGRGEVFWTWPKLDVGEAVAFEMEGRGLRADPSAVSTATVTSIELPAQTAQATTQIVGDGGAIPPVNNPGVPAGPQAEAGAIKLDVTALDNPALVGRDIRYQITVRNDSVTADRNIVISIELPDGMKLKKFVGLADVKLPDRPGPITLPAIIEIRGKEQVRPIEMQVTVDRAGTVPVKVTARSERMPQGVEEVEEVRVVQD